MLTRSDFLEMCDKIDSGKYDKHRFGDEKFYEDVCKALKINPNSRASRLIYSRAYQEARSNGWSAILNEMDDLLDFFLEVHQVVMDGKDGIHPPFLS